VPLRLLFVVPGKRRAPRAWEITGSTLSRCASFCAAGLGAAACGRNGEGHPSFGRWRVAPLPLPLPVTLVLVT
jgi:hypothetical protein